MQQEFEILMDNGTWELVDLPGGHAVVNNVWTYNMKLDPEGEMSRYTARFVASGPTSTTVTPSPMSSAWLASAFSYHRRRHGNQIVSARNGHIVSICSHQ
jgi:hypothetical protein